MEANHTNLLLNIISTAENWSPTHLLVDGGVTSAGGHPHLLVELVTDGVRHVDGGVCVCAQNDSEEKHVCKLSRWAVRTSVKEEDVSVLEALEAKLQSKLPSLVHFLVHHRGNRLRVLHDHRHLAVPLSQHAPVVDVGRAFRSTEEENISESTSRWRRSS